MAAMRLPLTSMPFCDDLVYAEMKMNLIISVR
jgi:hypothetical protein